MVRSIVVTRAVAGLLWIVQLVLGILFWTGHALGLAQLHMMLGTLFVIAIWILALLCARAGAPVGLVALNVVWAAMIPALGFLQIQLLPGPNHWVIRVGHLITVLIAMPLAGRLSMTVESGGRLRPVSSPHGA